MGKCEAESALTIEFPNVRIDTGEPGGDTERVAGASETVKPFMMVELGDNRYDVTEREIALLSIYRESDDYATILEASVIEAPSLVMLWPMTYTVGATEIVDGACRGWMAALGALVFCMVWEAALDVSRVGAPCADTDENGDDLSGLI